MSEENEQKRLTKRERLAIRLVVVGIWLLSPWRWDHQAKEHFDALRKELEAD